MTALQPRPQLLLASRSPQRREILTRLGIAFEACGADVEERNSGEPAAAALENALLKARSFQGAQLVLGVDTLVALDGRIYGKPASEQEALSTLRSLSGRTHEVISALALISPSEERHATVRTSVSVRTLDEALLDWYVACGEWRGRAGGYAIQGRGAALVACIEGDYTNVVGLPVPSLLELAPQLLYR